MRKIALAAGLLALGLGLLNAQGAVTIYRGASIMGNGGGAGFWLSLQAYSTTQTEVGGAETTTSNGFAYFTNTQTNQSASASGPLTITYDPTLTVATITGTLQGNNNNAITLDLTYRRTAVNTLPPYAGAEVDPIGPNVNANLGISTQGRLDGTVATPVGNATVVSQWGSMSTYLYATGP